MIRKSNITVLGSVAAAAVAMAVFGGSSAEAAVSGYKHCSSASRNGVVDCCSETIIKRHGKYARPTARSACRKSVSCTASPGSASAGSFIAAAPAKKPVLCYVKFEPNILNIKSFNPKVPGAEFPVGKSDGGSNNGNNGNNGNTKP